MEGSYICAYCKTIKPKGSKIYLVKNFNSDTYSLCCCNVESINFITKETSKILDKLDKFKSQKVEEITW